jgi:hypothetical protein
VKETSLNFEFFESGLEIIDAQSELKLEGLMELQTGHS